MAGLKKGLVGRIMSKLEDLNLGKALFLHCIIHQQVYIIHHTLFETFGYFLRDETSRLGDELYSESRINSPPIPDFS